MFIHRNATEMPGHSLVPNLLLNLCSHTEWEENLVHTYASLITWRSVVLLNVMHPRYHYVDTSTHSGSLTLSVMSFRGWFCMRRKGRTGIVGGYTQRVKNYMGWALERPSLAPGGPFLSSYAHTGWVNSPDLNLHGPNSFSSVWTSGWQLRSVTLQAH